MTYNICMAAYNAEPRIHNTLNRNKTHVSNLTVVNDGSTDLTSEEVLRFNAETGLEVELFEVPINKKKVGAVRDFVESLPSSTKHVVLMDDDSHITTGKHSIVQSQDRMATRNLVGGTFRLNVYNPSNVIEKLQSLEYSIGNGMRRVLGAKGFQRCVPGAAGIYQRDALEDVLESHSGDHDGDDFEITYSLLEKGHDLGYLPDVTVETKVPSTIGELIQQRRRWERGAIKTNWRKRKFLGKNILKGNRLSLLQATEVGSHALLPAGIAAAAAIGGTSIAPAIIPTFVIGGALLAAGKKRKEMTNIGMLPLLPVYHMAVALPSRALAYWDGVKSLFNRTSEAIPDLELPMPIETQL